MICSRRNSASGWRASSITAPTAIAWSSAKPRRFMHRNRRNACGIRMGAAVALQSASTGIYAGKILQKDRISFGDVQRLQRSVLRDGIGSREEAELLIELIAESRSGMTRGAAVSFAMIVDFVVWGERP